MTAAQDRVAKGLCPLCGKEAAPFLHCYACRFGQRVNRFLKRGLKTGALQNVGGSTLKNMRFIMAPGIDPKTNSDPRLHEWGKWNKHLHLPESDGRATPRIRGVRIDVDHALLAVMQHIGRPCTVEEIMAAYGKLRDRRTSPLPADLARIIKAKEKRERRASRHVTSEATA